MNSQRTDQQRKAIEVYCREIADQLTSAGFDIKKTLKEDFEIQWTQSLVKELMFKPLCKALFKHESTTQLSTSEVSEVARALTDHLAKNRGVYIEFPDNNRPPVACYDARH